MSEPLRSSSRLRMEVISGDVGRRRWPDEDKGRIAALFAQRDQLEKLQVTPPIMAYPRNAMAASPA